MPNYRQKNKKKNNKKNNKNNNNNNNNNNRNQNQKSANQNKSNQSQQGEQQENTSGEVVREEQAKLLHEQEVGNVSSEPTVDCSNHNKEPKDIANCRSTSSSAKASKDDGTGKRSNDDAAQCNDDTVSKENSTQKNELEVTVSEQIDRNSDQIAEMGTKQSKVVTATTTENVEPEIYTEREHEGIANEAKTQQVKLIIHRIVPEAEPEREIETQPNVIVHSIAIEQEPDDEEYEVQKDYMESVVYQVQSPSSNDESFELVNDTNDSQLQIQEVLNEDMQADEMHSTIGTAKIDENKLKRAQKRAAIENHFLPQLLSPRYLDSISEENSDLSDGSDRPRVRRSHSASYAEGETGQEVKTKRVNAKFPRSQLDFSKTHKHGDLPNTLPTLPGPICEEPITLMVEAKLIEQLANDAQESCSTLSFKHLEPQLEAAEVIFINSSTSSSASDLFELTEEEANKQTFRRETVDLDTDVKEIITKPANNETADRESTPVNQATISEQTIAESNEPVTTLINLNKNEIFDQLNSDEQFSEHSSATLAVVDTSISSCYGHESNTSELQATADSKSSTADDISVLSTTSVSDSSIVDASVEDSSSAEAFEHIENTCREIMDNVREIVFATNESMLKNNNNNKQPIGISSLVSLVDDVTYTPVTNGKHKSPSPPPIPPPPFSFSESAYINVIKNETPLMSNKPEVPIKSSSKILERQESADSHCSSSTNQSQCTAINIASPLLSDNDAYPSKISTNDNLASIQKLRQLCTQKLASLPYGEEVLEELATVAQNIGDNPLKEKLVEKTNVHELEMSIDMKKPHEIVHRVLIEDDQLLHENSKTEMIDNNMKSKLRKNLTPSPPPLPPPPVPTKSSMTVAKAQQTTTSRIIPIEYVENDASTRNVNTKEQKTTFTPLNEYEHNKQAQQNNTTYANEIATKTSSFENNSRQQASFKIATGKELTEIDEQKHIGSKESIAQSSNNILNNLPLRTKQTAAVNEMQSVESEIGRMFPTLGTGNIFDASQKRFSNIEGTTAKTFPTLTPKRYSNIETSSFEKGKRIENGQVIYDYEDRRQEAKQEGDQLDASASANAKIHDIHIDKSQMKNVNERMTESMRSTTKLNEQLHTIRSEQQKVHEEFRPRLDQEKLFKDFDDLSQQLHHELETGRKEREQREKSASLFDLSRNHMKQQLDELKKKRHEHMKELEREIDRSMKSRQTKNIYSFENNKKQEQTKAYEIPVQLKDKHKTHEIPITIETDAREAFQHDSNSPFRRAESMYDLVTSQQPTKDAWSRPQTASSNYESQQQLMSDDWSQYASDLGSSENITRPFAREMQICYQRQQPAPRGIRAPRLTVSTHDLSAAPSYDYQNAFNVPRSARNATTTSCYSLLERDPNPTYISTTSRRGVSPAPVQQQTAKPTTHARRASLPREIHEQQLKYISNKEEELRTEFERLQNERRRLLEELEQEQVEEREPQIPTRARDLHRGAPRLPTLSEDEVFRQQMAEEWMSKVAEREERRLHKIIKVSKIHEEHAENKYAEEEHINNLPQAPHKPDLSQEFLSRVKERRHKLHMPADSDWESGAESHPNTANQQQADTAEPNIKVISGTSIKNVHELPQHLKEFARYSNQQTDALENGGHRHVYEEEEKHAESTPYATSSASKKSSMLTTMKIARQPPHTLAPRQDTSTLYSSSDTECENFAESSAFGNYNMPDKASSMHNTQFIPKLPEVFEQMFASSPFRDRIYEEYERFWHNFNQQTFFD